MSTLSSKIKQSDNISAKRYFVLPMKSREYLKSSYYTTDDAPFFFNRYKTTGFSLGDIAVQVKPAKQVNGTNTSYYKKELSFAVSAPVSLPTHTTVVSSAAVPTPTTAFSVLLPLPAPTPTPTPYYTGKVCS
ncbi:hypothetical protein INT48_000824 [Thamnidium elegans]|uniref:Uncharacterized protein n=1 Tax=Thamnidium elegans TaxID=101142 RepID=A0A8H7SVY0_9FUNG|nr:hypothetical protein INT48_000824 [Thamnidium elegans]